MDRQNPIYQDLSIPQTNTLEFIVKNKDALNQRTLSIPDIRAISDEIELRSIKLPKERSAVESLSDDQIKRHIQEADLIAEAKQLMNYLNEKRSKLLEATLNGSGQILAEYANEQTNTKEVKHMNETIELKSFQKYITEGSRNMNETELRALNLVGSAAVLPVEVANNLITSTKFADLLPRATVMNIPNAGNVYVPIASDTAAAWRTELDAGAEASPTLTKLELGGYELMRLLQISAASSAMTSAEFINMLSELLGAEVVDTLEASFITGNGIGKPKGLDSLTWDASNQKLTTNAQTPIAASDIAAGLALLPQKYARNAVLIMNADMAYKVGLFKATAEYGYDLATGATGFMGHPIIINEHVSNDEIYAVDPRQLYVRFASPIMVEVDKSAGFTSASIYLRALAVVDAAWNAKACVRISLGA